MANIKKLQKELIKLNEEELKNVLQFLTDEDEVVETQVEEVKETVVEKVEVKEEPKKEVQEQSITLSKTDLESLISGILSKYVTKDEIKEVEEKVDKVSKKATPFGATQKAEKVEVQETINVNDVLSKLNSQFV